LMGASAPHTANALIAVVFDLHAATTRCIAADRGRGRSVPSSAPHPAACRVELGKGPLSDADSCVWLVVSAAQHARVGACGWKVKGCQLEGGLGWCMQGGGEVGSCECQGSTKAPKPPSWRANIYNVDCCNMRAVSRHPARVRAAASPHLRCTG
jgi:hypothetical protein